MVRPSGQIKSVVVDSESDSSIEAQKLYDGISQILFL